MEDYAGPVSHDAEEYTPVSDFGGSDVIRVEIAYNRGLLGKVFDGVREDLNAVPSLAKPEGGLFAKLDGLFKYKEKAAPLPASPEDIVDIIKRMREPFERAVTPEFLHLATRVQSAVAHRLRESTGIAYHVI